MNFGDMRAQYKTNIIHFFFSDFHVGQQQEHAPEDSQGGQALPLHTLRCLLPPEGTPSVSIQHHNNNNNNSTLHTSSSHVAFSKILIFFLLQEAPADAGPHPGHGAVRQETC